MAGNPFRRAQPDRIAESGGDGQSVGSTPAKKKKRVVIQSPPQSPEEVPRRLSAGRVSPPPPQPEDHEHDDEKNDSDSTATADSDLEQASLNTRKNSGPLQPPSAPAPSTSASGAPSNPFARTLASSEASTGAQKADNEQEDRPRANGENSIQTGGGRPAMDVEAFKNILLTGSAAPSPHVSTPQQRMQENSNTETSKQSRSDPYFEVNQETPRTSFDNMDESSASDDDEEGSSLMSGSERLDDFAPPAPPKHSHGKPLASRGPQTVSFADFDDSVPNTSASQTDSTSSSSSNTLRPQMAPRSASDLNKPLPPAPRSKTEQGTSAKAEADEIPSTSTSQPKKAAPPPPPASRRTGQNAAAQVRDRSSSNSKPTSTEDTSPPPPKPAESTSKANAAPPPPPTRKSRPVSQSTAPSTESSSEVPSPPPQTTEAKSSPMPPPPPRRHPSKTGPGSSVNRTPSNASRSSVTRKESQAPSNQNAPAPPPPRRGGNANRQSTEVPPSTMANASNNRRVSDNDSRRMSNTSVDSGRAHAYTIESKSVAETPEPPDLEKSSSQDSTDILADMNALQAEIDALRAKAGQE